MASLREVVREHQNELKEGIAWVIFWKEGRSWYADYVYLETNDSLSESNIEFAKKIIDIDPNAVILNSYYCGHLGNGDDTSLNELVNGVKWHYENKCNKLINFLTKLLISLAIKEE